MKEDDLLNLGGRRDKRRNANLLEIHSRLLDAVRASRNSGEEYLCSIDFHDDGVPFCVFSCSATFSVFRALLDSRARRDNLRKALSIMQFDSMKGAAGAPRLCFRVIPFFMLFTILLPMVPCPCCHERSVLGSRARRDSRWNALSTLQLDYVEGAVRTPSILREDYYLFYPF